MADMTDRLAPERIADIGFRYTQTKGTVRSIAKSARMSMDQFYALREQQGWPLRRSPDKTFNGALRRLPPPEGAAETERVEAPRGEAPADPAKTVGRAKRLAHDIVADLQRDRLRRPRAFAARAARELTAVARVLEQVRRIEEALGANGIRDDDTRDDAQASGRSLTELRDELYRRLVDARRDRGGEEGVPGEAEPG